MQAINQNITRRTALAVAAAVIPAMTIPVLALDPGSDPIYAAIENYKAAFLFHGECLKDANAIEDELDRANIEAAHAQVPEEIDLYNRHLADREADPFNQSETTRKYLRGRHNRARYDAWQARKESGAYAEVDRVHEKGADAQAKAAWAMVTCVPATVAGAAALVAYYRQAQAEGHDIAGFIRYRSDDTEEHAGDVLLCTLATFLAGLAAQS